MTDSKAKLIREEDAAWAEFRAEIDKLTPEQMAVDGYYPEWSVKDLTAHMACWMAESARVLEQIRNGTYAGWAQDVDGSNARWYQVWRDQELRIVWAELYAARARMLEEWDRLPADLVDDRAVQCFRESGVEHNDDHLPRLREWIAELG